MSRAPARPERRPPFEFEGGEVAAGSAKQFDVRVARLPTGSWATMPTTIVHGKRPGPTVWLSGAIHGDELNGVEIVRRMLKALEPRKMAGTVMAVPIVNVFGVEIESRYLPDRRDLNRSFPGSKRGSLAARLAHLFFDRVALRCSLGLDFHTGSAGRCNLPQLRCDLDDDETRQRAYDFGAPLLMHSTIRDGSLREAAREQGIPVLLFEAGEASRFDAAAIEVGVNGSLRVLHALGMIDEAPPEPEAAPWISRSSRWVRASRSGFCHMLVELGSRVEKGDTVATVTDSVGKKEMPVRARASGVVIGLLRTAMVRRGDALAHIAGVEPADPD